MSLLSRALIGVGAAMLTLTVAPVADAASGGCAANGIVSYTPAPGTDGAFGITQGPGGTWYAHGDTINRIDNDRREEFPLPGDADAGWLTWDGSSSYIWFADRGTGRLGTLNGRGAVHEFQIPDGQNGPAVPQGIVVGPGSFVWFTDQVNDRLGSLDTATGAIEFHSTPTADGSPLGLTRGPDGALWFTERSGDKVGRMAADGSFREWSLAEGSFPNRIVTGPDGAIWFTELLGGKLGRITMTGALTEYPIDGGPVGITVGPDGQLYVGLFFSAQVARVSTAGAETATWQVPGALQVTASRDSVWASDPFSDTVSRVRTHC